MKANRSSQPECQRVGIRSIALFALSFMWSVLAPLFLPEEMSLIRSQQMFLLSEIPMTYILHVVASIVLAASVLHMLGFRLASVSEGHSKQFELPPQHEDMTKLQSRKASEVE